MHTGRWFLHFMQQQTQVPDDHPIFEACKSGDSNTVERYLKEGISVYAESEHNSCIAALAARYRHQHILELLVKYGLDLNRPFNRFGEPLLYIALRTENEDLMEYFFRNGVSPSVEDEVGGSPIKLAAGGGNIAMIKLLMRHGVDVLKKGKDGHTPFRDAARNDRIAAMHLLYEAGADIDEPDHTGTTPLIGCAKGGKLDAVRWLLDHGADINAEDQRGKTALDWARANGHTNVVEALQKHLGN